MSKNNYDWKLHYESVFADIAEEPPVFDAYTLYLLQRLGWVNL